MYIHENEKSMQKSFFDVKIEIAKVNNFTKNISNHFFYEHYCASYPNRLPVVELRNKIKTQAADSEQPSSTA